MAPIAGKPLVLVPSVSWLKQTLTVDAVDGASIPGLPDADLSGWSAGIGAEYPVARDWLVLGGLDYVGWTTAKDLIEGDPAFFPGGSAHAFELQAGAGWSFAKAWSVRALFTFSSTSYSLDADPTGTYVASSATDKLLGGG
ncbi:MAG: hypothetical protein QM767_01490 [Anaeromyxobacter sp.]